MSIVGFDFGTTNSLVSIIEGGRVRTFLDEENMPVPSVVCYEGSKKIVGRSAKERLADAGLGIKGNVVRSPKMLLGRESVHIDGVEYSPVDIVSDVVQYVCADAMRRHKLKQINRAVVTIPVTMQGFQRAALRDAFRKAGVAIVQFIHEPLAALYGYLRSEGDYESLVREYNRKLLLVFDWGGGTLDLTLCRFIDGMIVQIRNDGTEEVGGDVFDVAIKNEVERKVSAELGLDESAQIHPDAGTRLLHLAERAKIDLSSRKSVKLYLRSFFKGITDEDLDYTLSREEMEAITKPYIDKGIARINRLLQSANVTSAEISLCLASGGMTNMPAIRARLHEWFGPQRVHISDRGATLIAEGAAWAAHDKIDLQLAKNIELLLARNSSMKLIRAGARMPKEGEECKEDFHLYCADPRDGYAKFQLQAPFKPGANVLPNDQRECLDSIIVEVDQYAQPFRERLELEVRIDENLVLHAAARSLNKQDIGTAEIHNLEFGLSLMGPSSADLSTEDVSESSKPEELQEWGALEMRSNVTHKADRQLIPGDLLDILSTDGPDYHGWNKNLTQVQIEEQLYYKPCAGCGRASNDPLCHCSRHGSGSATNRQVERRAPR
jgi:molecular chaperone DnaK